MFRRREEEIKDSTNNDSATSGSNANASSGSTASSGGSAQAASPLSNASVGLSSASTMMAPAQPLSPSRPVEAAKPATAASTTSFRPSAPSAARSAHDRMSGSAANQADKGGKNSRRVLTVGHDILLKGEIATCDRLVIEGEVDATLNDVHTVEIAETGSFKGSAKIEDAEISGMFEGELEVRGRLVIYASGKVRGKITYGEIEIERGGELTGEIKMSSSGVRSESKKNAA